MCCGCSRPANLWIDHDVAMRAVDLVLAIVWLVFWFFWLIAAFTAKSGRSGGWSRLTGLRVLIFVAFYIVVRDVGLRGHSFRPGPVMASIGLLLFLLGLALAVWARLYIGRNWGTPMSRKEEPELVTTGPYRLIRHPIYSGLILAMIGTALATTLYGLIAVAVLSAFFIYSATREEAYLTEQFQDTYRDYKHSTKMLIPFIL
jgi:protein-S-isoprenylcysteine O-methyltransferase Ste14